MQSTNYICNTEPLNPALNKVQISNYPMLWYQRCAKNQKTVKNSAIFLSHSFIIFFHSFIIKFAAICVWIDEYDWLDNISKTLFEHFHTQTLKTQQKSVTFSFISTNFPTHDKVKTLCIVIICKNYSVIHVILNENESFWHNCLLKVRNLVKFLNNLQHLCFWTNEYKRPY